MIISGSKALDVKHEMVKTVTPSAVEIGWNWYDEQTGTVSWNFRNNGNQTKTVILFRNSYYFGNAYWCIYVNNEMTYWAKDLSVLPGRSVIKNTMPIGIVDFRRSKRIIAFLFTLSAGQDWSALEGGFSSSSPPANPALFEVTFKKSADFCIGYDEVQVTDWNAQTGSTMSGYSPNPSTIRTVEVSAPAAASFYQLFNDTIDDGKC